MNINRAPKKAINSIGIVLALALVASLIWDGLNGFGLSDIFTGISLLLVAGAMLYIKQMGNVSERAVSQRIKAEYSPETQKQALEIFEHLKTKELEGLFLKILDDANGDINKVRNLASVAESVGWRAFIENHW